MVLQISWFTYFSSSYSTIQGSTCMCMFTNWYWMIFLGTLNGNTCPFPNDTTCCPNLSPWNQHFSMLGPYHACERRSFIQRKIALKPPILNLIKTLCIAVYKSLYNNTRSSNTDLFKYFQKISKHRYFQDLSLYLDTNNFGSFGQSYFV